MNLTNSTSPWPKRAARVPFDSYALGALLVVGLAFAMRLYRLGSVEFWFDETASYSIASQDYLGILNYVRQASGEHPPLYYFGLHTWMSLAGSSEFSMRFMSLCLGVLVVALLYRFARREFGASLGLGASVAVAASPFMFMYSQEARMYTLVPLLGLLSMQAFLQAVRRGGIRDWVTLALVMMIGVASHYYFALALIGQGLFLLARFRSLSRTVLLGWIAMVSVYAALLLAWLLISPGLLSFLPALFMPRFAPWTSTIERLVQDMVWGGEPFAFTLSATVRLLIMVAWLPLLYGVWVARPRLGWRKLSQPEPSAAVSAGRNGQAYLLCLATLAGSFFAIIIAPQGVVGRHFAIMQVPFLVLLTYGLAELNRRYQARGVLAVAAIIIIFAIGLQNQMARDKGDWGQAMAALAQEAKPGDALVMLQPSVRQIVDYYQRRIDLTAYYLEQVPGALTEYRLSDTAAANVNRFIQDIGQRHERIWLVISGERDAEAQQIIPRWLEDQRFAVRTDFHRAVSLYLFMNGKLDPASLSVHARFGSHIQLMDAQLNNKQLSPGDALLLNMRWQTDARLSADDQLSVRLTDDHGTTWAEQRLLPCGGFCLTSDWRVNEDVAVRQALVIPAGTPPGVYHVLLDVYDPVTHGNLAVGGKPEPLELSPVQIIPNSNTPLPLTAHPLSFRFGSALRLMGYDGTASTVRAGLQWPLDIVWGADDRVFSDMVGVLRWTDTRGVMLAETQLPVGTPSYPLTVWQPGIAIRRHYDVPLPDNAPGDIRAELLVRDRNSQEFVPLSLSGVNPRPLNAAYPAPDDAVDWIALNRASVDLGAVHVLSIDRQFFAPDVQHVLAVQLTNTVQLVGYALAPPSGRSLNVTLYWRALNATAVNYKVFVHVIARDDSVLAQHDGQPASDFRPTSGWLPGEFVTDVHRVDLGAVQPGTYRIEVGMYDPQSGGRLPVLVSGLPQPDERLVLSTVSLP
jgi:uncharacterized membrane protein